MSERRLIINADDYGLCPDVNSAIEELSAAGILGGVSVLANGACFHQAVTYLRQHPEISAGIHLNAVEGKPVSASAEMKILTDRNGLFIGLSGLLKRSMLRAYAVHRAVETEWRTQIERLLATGIKLVHIDSHQHLHIFPPFFECAVRICREYRIPAIRIPNEKFQDHLRFVGTLGLRLSLAPSRQATSTAGLHCNDHFLGFRRAGRYVLATLIADIASLPPGLTELAVHPSIKNNVPYPHYKGDEERKALLDEAFNDRLRELGVKLVSWADMNG
jgi:chitin disaccharide deacetylase